MNSEILAKVRFAVNYLWISFRSSVKMLFFNRRSCSVDYSGQTPLFSVIVPVYNVKQKFFAQMVNSVLTQTYGNFELCIADASDENEQYVEYVNKCNDPRIKYKKLENNFGIAGNTRAAILMSKGLFLVFLDHDDLLNRNALKVLSDYISKNENADYLYTDEDQFSKCTFLRRTPFYKPDFSPEYLLGLNYICHLVCIRRSLYDRVGGLRSEYDGSQDFDLALRATQKATQIIHVPEILYHWRVHEGSVAMSFDAKDYAQDAAINALNDFLNGGTTGRATVKACSIKGRYISTFNVKSKVSVVMIDDLSFDINASLDSLKIAVEPNDVQWLIVSTDSACELRKRCELEAFEVFATINEAVSSAGHEILLFWSSELKLVNKEGLLNGISLVHEDGIGAVGGTIRYANCQEIASQGYSISHSKINVLMQGMPVGSRGYFDKGLVMSNVTAVSLAGMITLKSTWTAVRGFDESYEVLGLSIEYCLRLTKEKLRVVLLPEYEIASEDAKLVTQISTHDLGRLTDDRQLPMSLSDPYMPYPIERYYSKEMELRD